MKPLPSTLTFLLLLVLGHTAAKGGGVGAYKWDSFQKSQLLPLLQYQIANSYIINLDTSDEDLSLVVSFI